MTVRQVLVDLPVQEHLADHAIRAGLPGLPGQVDLQVRQHRRAQARLLGLAVQGYWCWP